MQNSILNIEVSCFANYNTPDNPRPVNLLQWLTNAKYADKVNTIRSIDNKDHRDRIKATLPAITPSGLFTYRAKKNLIRHSGFIQIDIDPKGNETISNYSALKKEICKILNIAYCGLSVSGKGYWTLIPIEDPAKHKQYFEFIQKWFKEKGITIDRAPRSVASLRGYAYDPDGYFNHVAKPLEQFYTEPVNSKRVLITSEKSCDVFRCAQNFATRKAEIFQHKKNAHNYIFYLCSYLCYRGVSRHDAESWIYENLLPKSEINSNCISYPYENYIEGQMIAIEQPKKTKPLNKQPDKTLEVTPVNTITRKVRQGIFTENWSNEINELENFFSPIMLPSHKIVLSSCMTISDCSLFIQSHLATIKANNGNNTFLPYLTRAKTLKQLFENNKNLQR